MNYTMWAIYIGCGILGVMLLLYLERDNIKMLPFALILVFASGGVLVANSIISYFDIT